MNLRDLPGMDRYEILTRACRSRYVYLLFFVLPLFVYYPLLEDGVILQGGADLLFGHYPFLLYGHEMLRHGDLGLWNRFIYDGFDYTRALHHHILYPLNWFTLLVPQDDALRVISIQLFLEICLSGCLAYLIAGLVMADPWARLLFAITFELCGFVWFLVTTFIGIHLLLLTLAAIYVLLTSERGGRAATFVWLSLCFAGILLVGHPGYLMGFGLVLIAVFAGKLFRYGSGRERLIFASLTVGAGIVGLATAAVRIVPVFQELAENSIVISNAWLPTSDLRPYFALAALIPGALGLNVAESGHVARVVGMPGLNGQFHVLHYFGIVPVFLAYLAILSKFGRSTFVATSIALAVAAIPFFVQPISDIFFLLWWPAEHEVVAKIASYFLLLAALAFALRALSEGRVSLAEREIRGFMILVVLTLAAFVTLWARVIHGEQLPHWYALVWILKGIVFVLLAIGAAVVLRAYAAPPFFSRLTTAGLLAFASLAFAGAVIGFRARLFTGTWLFLKTFADNLGMVAWAVGVLYLARILGAPASASRRHRAVAGIAGVVGIVLLAAPIPEMTGGRGAIAAGLAALWPAATFLVLACVVMELFARAFAESFDRRWLMPSLVLLVAGNLLYFNRDYEYVNGPPFVPLEHMYPKVSLPDRTTDAAAWQAAAAQPELLDHPRLAVRDGVATGWRKGGTDSSVETATGSVPAIRLVNRAVNAETLVDAATLFQDLTLAPTPARVSFGAWIRGDARQRIGLVVTTASAMIRSSYYSGSGRWEWLSVTVNLGQGGRTWIRPAIMGQGPGILEIYAPHLVAGPFVRPLTFPPENEIAPTPSLARAKAPPTGEEELDLMQYRVDHPGSLIGTGDSPSGIPVIHGLPTYAGLDSDVPASYLNFLTAFDASSSKWYMRAGLATAIESQRLLDLLGVRYNFRPDGGVDIRPNALARISLFKNFEVIPDREHALNRLKDPAFDPDTTLVLDRAPGWTPNSAEPFPRFRPLPYQSPYSRRIEVDYDEATPLLLLFDDSYSPLWLARLGGTALPVYRANVNFMAVSLPAGKGVLQLTFEPKMFFWLARLSLALGSVLVLSAAALIISGLFSRHMRRGSLPDAR